PLGQPWAERAARDGVAEVRGLHDTRAVDGVVDRLAYTVVVERFARDVQAQQRVREVLDAEKLDASYAAKGLGGRRVDVRYEVVGARAHAGGAGRCLGGDVVAQPSQDGLAVPGVVGVGHQAHGGVGEIGR